MDLHAMNLNIVIAVAPVALIALFAMYVKYGEITMKKVKEKHQNSHEAGS